MRIKEEEKSGEVVLLKGNLNNILMTFDLNFVDNGKSYLKQTCQR